MSVPSAPMSSSRAPATSSCTRTVSWHCSEYPAACGRDHLST
jgi:hypothetical protein